jgi:Spx/MgsR family transcriptional regulator
MRDTFKLLESLDAEYEFVDVKKTPLSVEELSDYAVMLGLDGLINRKGTTWRKLSDEEKAYDDKRLLELLLSKQTMIKRPLLVNERSVMVGYDEDAIKDFVSGKDAEE